CLSVDHSHGEVRAIFRIADVPAEADYPAWTRTVRKLLPSADPVQYWTVFDDGTIEVRSAIAAPSDAADEVEVLTSALKQADVIMHERRLVTAKEDLLARQKR
ncbi:hypothetical protein, partial [Bacillus mobilis]|uniref:hypothetical protein n=3 Tax=Bacillati TaxID=1783272 RepID=UPI00363CBC94